MGEITSVDASMIKALLDDGRIPVVSSLARGTDGPVSPDGTGGANTVYNVNADTAAAALAVALKATSSWCSPTWRACTVTGPTRTR